MGVIGQWRGGLWAIVAAAAVASAAAHSAFDSLEVAAPPLSDAEARRPYERKYGGSGFLQQVRADCNEHECVLLVVL